MIDIVIVPLAIGAVMLAAPLYFHIVEPWPAILFWGGVLVIVAAIYLRALAWIRKKQWRAAVTTYLLISAGMSGVVFVLSLVGWALLRTANLAEAARTNEGRQTKTISTAEEIVRQLTGGDSFCYLFANLSAPRSPEGEFQLEVVNAGPNQIPHVSWWPYPAGANANYHSAPYRPSPYEHLAGNLSPALPTSLALYGKFVGLGSYGVDFSGSNGDWIQSLVLSEENGEVTERITVTRGGGKVVFDKVWKARK